MSFRTTTTQTKSGKTKPDRSRGRPFADLWERPGYLVRRLHQIHLGLFAEECGEFDITPIQFGLLTILTSGKALDQVTLSKAVGIDRNSGADVIKRLQRRGLLQRVASEQDRRAKLVRITDEGKSLVRKMQRHMERAQERLIAPLTPSERSLFNDLLQKVVQANNSASRAPIAGDFQGGREAI
jgi:DNA-binding MarR family transcriptional regulator